MSTNLLKHTYQEPEDRAIAPAGEYLAKITEMCAIGMSKAGNTILPFEMEITGPTGAKIKVEDNLVFTENALWKIDRFIRSAYPAIKPGAVVDFSIPSKAKFFVGRTCKIEVGVEEFVHKGKTLKKNVVLQFLTDTESAPSQAAAPASPPPAPEPTAPDVPEDDIPF